MPSDSTIKIVRQYFYNKKEATRTKIISLNSSFHGVTFGAMSAGGIPIDSERFKPVLEGFLKISPPYCFRCSYKEEYPSCKLKCASELEELIIREGQETIAAFIAEPILGAGGVIVPPANYFSKIKEICDKYGVKLIIDEVSTGFGRLGSVLGSYNWNIKPDIFVGAKGITSGYLPLGVVGIKEEIYEMFCGDVESSKQLNHGFTTSGHPVCCKAAIATLDVIQKSNLIETVKENGVFFKVALERLKNISIVEDIRGQGMMWGIELLEGFNLASLTAEIAYRKGLITFVTDAKNVIALFPPFITTKEELLKIVEILEASLVIAETKVKMASSKGE